MVFSLEALSQEQWRAACLPQEHLACWAADWSSATVDGPRKSALAAEHLGDYQPQTQVSPLPQQVDDLATAVAIMGDGNCEVV
jgi:hypothetical protein